MKLTADQRLGILVGFIGLGLLARALAIALYVSILPSTVTYAAILGLQFLMPEVDQLYWFNYWQVLLIGTTLAVFEAIVFGRKK